MTDITGNGNLLEGKPRQSITLRDIVDAINSIIQTELIDPVDDLEQQLSILTAAGIWLDYIGKKVDFPRPQLTVDDVIWFGFDDAGLGFDQAPFMPPGVDTVGIDDESYRALLIVRGGQLLTDCSIPSMNTTIDGAFSTGRYIDNGNMTIDVIIDSDLSDAVIIAIAGSGIITKPAGVRINETFVLNTSGTFGFDGNGVGFDQGTFVRTWAELLESIIQPVFLTDDVGEVLTDDAGNFLIT
ncbi:MAG: DUF2612 domain-containing protein [Candidatus Sabulitectum sp.]|nr:DUF2612 domain-containing protein [Candidatus Sabulitectum sp.]